MRGVCRGWFYGFAPMRTRIFASGAMPEGPLYAPEGGSCAGNGAQSPETSPFKLRALIIRAIAFLTSSGASSEQRTKIPFTTVPSAKGVKTYAVMPATLRPSLIWPARVATSGPPVSYATKSTLRAPTPDNCAASSWGLIDLGASLSSNFTRSARSVSALRFASAARAVASAMRTSAALIASAESRIVLSAAFWVASVISHPTHAETNADPILSVPNINADHVAILNTVSQIGSKNPGIPASFWALVVFAFRSYRDNYSVWLASSQD